MKTKLIDNIQVNLTNRRKAIPFPIAKYSYSETPQKDFEFQRGTELVVKIELGAAQFICDELLNTTESKSMVIDQAKRQIGRSITKHVYGDVQSKLIDIIDQMRQDGHYWVRNPDGSLDPLGQLYELLEMMDYS
jgi:hypothetical protein